MRYFIFVFLITLISCNSCDKHLPIDIGEYNIRIDSLFQFDENDIVIDEIEIHEHPSAFPVGKVLDASKYLNIHRNKNIKYINWSSILDDSIPLKYAYISIYPLGEDSIYITRTIIERADLKDPLSVTNYIDVERDIRLMIKGKNITQGTVKCPHFNRQNFGKVKIKK